MNEKKERKKVRKKEKLANNERKVKERKAQR